MEQINTAHVKLPPEAGLELCIVSEVISPSQVCLHRLCHVSYPSFDHYYKSLRETYENPSNDSVDIDRATAKVGLLCAGKIDEEFFRVKIIGLEENLCRVHLVDHGGHRTITYNNLKTLIARFVKYPMQAVECTVASVYPFQDSNGNPFSHKAEAIKYMRSLKGEKVMAQPICYDTKGTPFIKLFRITPTKKLVNVAEELSKMKLTTYKLSIA